NQLAQWEGLGLIISDGMRRQILSMTHDFAQAATTDDPAAAADSAEKALVAAGDAMDQLAAGCAGQGIGMGPGRAAKLDTWFGAHLGADMPALPVARQLLPSFNMVSVPMTWRAIEASEGRRSWKVPDAQVSWAHTAGMKVIGGPLLELDDRGVPDWT